MSKSAALTAKPSPKRTESGGGQDGACEEAERQKRGRCETAERNLPQLFRLAVRVGDEGNPVPAPVQADHRPAHRSRCPSVAELVQKSRATHDADSPDNDKAVTPRHLVPSVSQWSSAWDNARGCRDHPKFASDLLIEERGIEAAS